MSTFCFFAGGAGNWCTMLPTVLFILHQPRSLTTSLTFQPTTTSLTISNPDFAALVNVLHDSFYLQCDERHTNMAFANALSCEIKNCIYSQFFRIECHSLPMVSARKWLYWQHQPTTLASCYCHCDWHSTHAGIATIRSIFIVYKCCPIWIVSNFYSKRYGCTIRQNFTINFLVTNGIGWPLSVIS